MISWDVAGEIVSPLVVSVEEKREGRMLDIKVCDLLVMVTN